MRNVGRSILVLSLALLASAQVAKKCSAPLEYPQTSLAKRFPPTQRFISGTKVYYDCAEDFAPSRGLRAVQCTAQGTWTKLSLKCEKKSCGYAGDLLNGQLDYEGNSFIGEKANAVCNKGYTLKGPKYLICKRDGWSGEFPSCEEGEATCSSPTVVNSVSSGGGVSVSQVGDHVTFTCSQGFQLDGAQKISCGPDGQWQPQPPRCLPSPDDKTLLADKETGGCGVPVSGRNSNVHLADKFIKVTSFGSGDRVQYVCDIGHVQTGGSRFRKCIKGKWTPLLMRCERKSCGHAGDILNGQFTYTGVEFGDSATAVCDEGHLLVGQATRNCLSKGWDGRVPVCEAVECDPPTEATNAEMTGHEEPSYTYKTVIGYRCRAGTLIGQREIWCTKDGTWSAPPPTCEEKTCKSPNVPDAHWTGPQNVVYQYRDRISIECNRGYMRTGPNTVTCGINGQWYPNLPQCTQSRRTIRRG